MTLYLYNDSSLYEIKNEFNRAFPGLKLDFIFHGDEKLDFISHLHHSFSFAPVKELYPGCEAGNIEIEESMTIKEVEALFENNWHLPAKIYVTVEGYLLKNQSTEQWLLKKCTDSNSFN